MVKSDQRLMLLEKQLTEQKAVNKKQLNENTVMRKAIQQLIRRVALLERQATNTYHTARNAEIKNNQLQAQLNRTQQDARRQAERFERLQNIRYNR